MESFRKKNFKKTVHISVYLLYNRLKLNVLYQNNWRGQENDGLFQV